MKTLRTIAAAVALASGASAYAGTTQVDFSSNASLKGRGSFTGTAVYDSTTDKLTLDITNTSAGKLTGFALDIAPGDTAKYERGAGDKFKSEDNRKGLIKSKPYGTYEVGAGLGGKWTAASGKKGVLAGQSRSFVFDVTGPTASSLTALSFFDSTKNAEIVASFAGFKHGKRDRASGLGTLHVTPTDTITPVNSPTNQPSAPGGNTDPIIKGGPITVPTNPPNKGGNSNPVSAVPLPPAAPIGLATLILLGVAKYGRRLRTIFA